MRILYIKLINYIGIYNGLGLNGIEIDLTRSKHRTTIIRGKNGSGKSTLFNALHPMYDSNENFIPNLEAHKYIHLINDDIIYKIHFVHPVKSNGDRDTTKAYIKKYHNNEIEDLNPNGNVSSFKDVLYNEFSLDPNYIALSGLGSENRGLADKKPQDRKRFVNSIIESLVVYNDIYKTLTKRSSVFKAMINTLTSKIDNIGDEEKLKASLISIENRLNNLMSEKDQILEKISLFKSTIALTDPNNTIQDTYNKIYNDLNSYNNRYQTLEQTIDKNLNILQLDISIDYNTIIDNYNKLKDNMIKLNTDIQVFETNISILLKERESVLHEIETKRQRLSSIKSDVNVADLKSSISKYEDDIKVYKDIIAKMGLVDLDISRDEYIIALNTLNDIKNILDIFKSSMNYDIIQKSINYIRSNEFPDINVIDIEINDIRNIIKDNEILYQKFITIKEISEKVNIRPSNCKIDSCTFIKDSIDALNQKPDDNLTKISNILSEYNKLLLEKLKEKDIVRELIECINYLNVILRNIDMNGKIFNKINIAKNFTNKDNILDMILSGYNFDTLNEVYKYIDYSNIIDDYKSKVNILIQLKNDLNLYNSKYEIINEIEQDISKMRDKVDVITKSIDKIKIDMDLLRNNHSIINNNIMLYDVLIKDFTEKLNIESKKSELISQFNAIKASMITIRQSLDNVEQYSSRLNVINKEISPLIEDRDKIKYGLSLLKDYKQELIMYNSKYEKIETIKKYSSPNKGIQTLFMELYMNKILSMANELLSLLFEGEYILCPFIINENEFRIPCIGSGLQNDDISSTSCSQKAMMGLVINVALLFQSSSKYNILRMDELDSGLDTNNRLQFIHTMNKINNILKIEQCFLISHNSEIDLNECDIIQLKKVDGDVISVGNIIYEY